MATSIDPTTYVIGPAAVYYRAVGVLTPWTSIGSTLDDAVMRVTTERWQPDNLSGVPGAVMGLDVLRKVNAEIEFTMPEITGSKLGLVLPGAAITAETHAAAASPLATTLSATAVAGSKSISVVAATNAAVGDPISIAGASGIEYRVITDITSLVLGFRDPLLWDHASGQAVGELTGDYRTMIEAPRNMGRIADSEYREWALVASNGRGYQELRIPRGISTTESAEVTIGDSALAGIKVTIGARYLGSDLTQSPFKLYGPAN